MPSHSNQFKQQYYPTSYLPKASAKWLSNYNPSVNLNSSQYHFISEPSPLTHQKVKLNVGEAKREMIMYFQKQQNCRYKREDRKDTSELKDFEHLNIIAQERNQQIFLDKQKVVKQSIWANKYQPKAFYQLLTEELHNRNVLAWLKSWDLIVFNRQAPTHTPIPRRQYQSNFNLKNCNSFITQFTHEKLLLLSGPPGCGKTTLARVIARHCGYSVQQLNASDDRSAKALIAKIQAIGKSNSVIDNKPTMIIVDQVDGALQQDGNGMKQVLQYIKNGGPKKVQKKQKSITAVAQKSKSLINSKHPNPTSTPQIPQKVSATSIPRPIIFICNDPFVKSLKQLRSKCTTVYFKQIDQQRIISRLKDITEKQKIYIQSQVLKKIAQITNCDIRGSLSILQYICKCKKYNNKQPKELIQNLRLSLKKDTNTSIIQFVGRLLNQTKVSMIKEPPNFKEFSHTIHQIDNISLFIEAFYHNFSSYKSFMIKRPHQATTMYSLLKWTDNLMAQSFKYNNELDSFVMMPFLYHRMIILNEEVRRIEFPTGFFDRNNKKKHHKAILEELINKWPGFLRVTVTPKTAIHEYLYLLYFAVQTASTKDKQVIDCVHKMLTYKIELASKNSPYLFKPEFDALLHYGIQKPEVLYSSFSRSLIEQSYEFAKVKFNLLKQISLLDISAKSSQQMLSRLNVKNRRRKRQPLSLQNTNSTIKYKFIQGSGTQITYDLKYKYFFA